MLKIRVVKTITNDNNGECQHVQYRFHTAGTWKGDPQATINLGRSGGKSNCNRTITQLSTHNHEAPLFTDYDEGESYLERVLEDISKWRDTTAVRRGGRRANHMERDRQPRRELEGETVASQQEVSDGDTSVLISIPSEHGSFMVGYK